MPPAVSPTSSTAACPQQAWLTPVGEQLTLWADLWVTFGDPLTHRKPASRLIPGSNTHGLFPTGATDS
jgi:hypothetical protein